MKLSLFIILAFVISSHGVFSQNTTETIHIKKVWNTPNELEVPESVLYSHTQNTIFVSNISGKSGEKDGIGFISKLNMDGQITDKQWIVELNAPKGMAEFNNMLYVSDIDELVQIDLKRGKIINKYPAPNSKFLNDVATDSTGTIYVSDSGDQTIYVLKENNLVKWKSDDMLSKVNGLCVVGNNLYAGTANAILKINTKTKETEIWANNTGGIDGIEFDGKNGFFYSDWQGHVYHINKGEKQETLLDTTSEKINAADIGINRNEKMIYVPTFFDNRVFAYKYK